MALGTLEVSGEPNTTAGCRLAAVGASRNDECHRVAVAFGEGGAQGVGEAAGRVLECGRISRHLQTVHHDQQFLRGGEVVGLGQLIEVLQGAVLHDAHEALGAEALHHLGVCHLVAQAQGERDREARAGVEREQAIGDGLDAVGLQFAAADGAVRVPRARPQEAQEVIDLGGGADGGTRGARRVLLFDGDGGGEAVNEIDVGLLHALQELARVRRERLDVTPLPLGVDRVEGERALARPGRPGDDRDRAPGDVDADPLEVVLARAADDQVGLHAFKLTTDLDSRLRLRRREKAVV